VPIGACWAADDVAAAFVPGDHATTFGGQPLAASAARATLAVMEAEDVPALAQARGAYLVKALEAIPGIAGVRGAGLLVAAELEGKGAAPVAAAALDAGLVINPVTATALRLAPSLLVSEDEIDEAMVRLAQAMAGVDG
jgi:acetylornithine/succinyldiaminopimelate/putrescine aminotransferase